LKSILERSDKRGSSQKQLFSNDEWKIVLGHYDRNSFVCHKKMEHKIKEVNYFISCFYQLF